MGTDTPYYAPKPIKHKIMNIVKELWGIINLIEDSRSKDSLQELPRTKLVSLVTEVYDTAKDLVMELEKED